MGKEECVNTCFVHENIFLHMPMCAHLLMYMSRAWGGVYLYIYVQKPVCIGERMHLCICLIFCGYTVCVSACLIMVCMNKYIS